MQGDAPDEWKRTRIWREWDEIVNQDVLSDDEACRIVAKRAGVTFGEAKAQLTPWAQQSINQAIK